MFLEQKKIIMSWHLQVETKLGTYDHPDSGKFACTLNSQINIIRLSVCHFL